MQTPDQIAKKMILEALSPTADGDKCYIVHGQDLADEDSAAIWVGKAGILVQLIAKGQIDEVISIPEGLNPDNFPGVGISDRSREETITIAEAVSLLATWKVPLDLVKWFSDGLPRPDSGGEPRPLADEFYPFYKMDANAEYGLWTIALTTLQNLLQPAEFRGMKSKEFMEWLNKDSNNAIHLKMHDGIVLLWNQGDQYASSKVGSLPQGSRPTSIKFFTHQESFIREFVNFWTGE